jgi:hypothetical protein
MSSDVRAVRRGRSSAPIGLGRRDLVIGAVAIVGVSRIIDGPGIWLIAAFLLLTMLLGTLQVLAEDPLGERAGVPIESVILPSVAAVACLGAIRLVPLGLGLAPALLVTAILIDRCIAVETRMIASPRTHTHDDRTQVLVLTLIVAFLAFTGAAALVPGGLVEAGPSGPTALTEGNLVLLAAIDGLAAFLLGYRAVALRTSTLIDALWSAATYAGAIAIGAAALRAMEIPRLIGPAVLTLAFYLWDAFHGAPSARRRDVRWIGQTLLLVILGAIVIGWNLLLRDGAR